MRLSEAATTCGISGDCLDCARSFLCSFRAASFSWENAGKSWENNGKSWENHDFIMGTWENAGTMMRKSWHNDENKQCALNGSKKGHHFQDML